MSRQALLLSLVAALSSGCATHRPEARSEPPPSVPPAPPPAAVAALPFEQAVRPILSRSCTPCHVPGGKMYERLPFDDPATVASHRDGILRRLKAPEDRQVVEDWIARQPPPR